MTGRKERKRPSYRLDDVKERARAGQIAITGRPRRFIENRYGRFDIKNYVIGLIEALSEDDFLKSEMLEVIDGVWADIYSGVEYEDEAWYVKFYEVEDGSMVCVLSANWDGYIH